tara:strand:+ start:1821 stop:2849 length:1029 start_codon:yes stop_codon:yes gene_type:complete
MKLHSKNKNNYFSNPDPSMTGLLIYGSDSSKVKIQKKKFIDSLLGKKSDEEMRLQSILPTDLRKDHSLLIDAIKAKGFFPGKRCILIENASDNLTNLVMDCCNEWVSGDAHILLTSPFLSPKSSLRKFFESHNKVYVAPIFDDPTSPIEIDSEIKKFGLNNITKDASNELLHLGQALNMDEFSQILEKLSLYKLNDSTPVNCEDVNKIAPIIFDAGLEDVASLVASGRTSEVSKPLKNLEARGFQAVSLCVSTTLYFKKLYKASIDPLGIENGVRGLKPPVSFKKTDDMVKQIKLWGSVRLSEAIHMLIDLDLELRSNSGKPNQSLMERTMIRLSLLSKKKN